MPATRRQGEDAGATRLRRPQGVDAHRCTPARPRGDRCDDPLRADRGVDDLVGPVEERPVEGCRGHVDRADEGTTAARHRDRRQPHPTAADHDDGLAPFDRGPGDDGSVRRGDPASQPCGDARHEPLGQGDEVGLGGVHDDELGEGAGVGEARLPLVRADLPGSRPADGAAPARHDERGGDGAPDPAVVDALADRLHRARELVAGHMGKGRDVVVVAHPPVPVAAAQTARDDPHDRTSRVAGSGRGATRRQARHRRRRRSGRARAQPATAAAAPRPG